MIGVCCLLTKSSLFRTEAMRRERERRRKAASQPILLFVCANTTSSSPYKLRDVLTSPIPQSSTPIQNVEFFWPRMLIGILTVDCVFSTKGIGWFLDILSYRVCKRGRDSRKTVTNLAKLGLHVTASQTVCWRIWCE
ncbi:hypothetical protein K440DRAFT_10618 [Wilcoxina mikolae CBS 423.85]|nr:hypothetical protein K440DRAFT_10618 [Wilcoxina mikolae CBS 423.85]